MRGIGTGRQGTALILAILLSFLLLILSGAVLFLSTERTGLVSGREDVGTEWAFGEAGLIYGFGLVKTENVPGVPVLLDLDGDLFNETTVTFVDLGGGRYSVTATVTMP